MHRLQWLPAEDRHERHRVMKLAVRVVFHPVNVPGVVANGAAFFSGAPADSVKCSVVSLHAHNVRPSIYDITPSDSSFALRSLIKVRAVARSVAAAGVPVGRTIGVLP